MKSKFVICAVSLILTAFVMLSACSSKQEGASSSAGEKISLSVYNAATFNQAAPVPAKEDDVLRQMLEKAVDVDFNMMVPPQGQDVTKLNLLISSGETPDIMNFRARDRAYPFYDQGILADLDPILDKYPALKARFTEQPWAAMKYNGKTIGIPVSDSVDGLNSWWIRNDWLKKLNLSVPTTPDELLTVLKAFTFNDLDGNGKADTYGIVGGVSKDGAQMMGLEGLYTVFGAFPNQIDVKDGKLVIYNTDNRTKETFTYLHKLYTAKVIDPDFATISDATTLDQKFFKGKAGFAIRDWRSMEPNSQQKMKDLGGEIPEWIAIPPIKGPFGDQISTYAATQNTMWSISQKAAIDPEKLDRIMQLLTYWYTDKEAYPYFAYGVKGINWDVVDGKVKKLTPAQDIADKYTYIQHYILPRRGDDPVYFNYLNPKTDEYRQINLKYLYTNKYNSAVVPDPNDMAIKDRQKYTNEMFLSFITGKQSISNWDKYVTNLDNKFDEKKYEANVAQQLKEQGLL